LRDRGGWLRRAAETLHLFRPEKAFSGVSFASGFPRPLASKRGADLCAADPIAKNAPSRWAAMGNNSVPCGCGQCH
jgi:hypothetical protein